MTRDDLVDLIDDVMYEHNLDIGEKQKAGKELVSRLEDLNIFPLEDRINLSDELDRFLTERCKAGEYSSITLMINNEVFDNFFEYLNNYVGKAAAVDKRSCNATILGRDKFLNVVPSEEE